jgi:phage/plasmid primase-like uncharacterized protein
MHDPAQAFRSAILATFGYAPDVIEPGKLQRFPTSDRRGDDAGWCKLFDDQRGGVFGDFRRGFVETWCGIDRGTMTAAERAAFARQVAQASAEREAERQRTWARSAERNAKLQAELQPLVPGDPVTLYLKRRGFGGVWPLPACLRLHRALPYWRGTEKLGTYPAMVAPIVAPDGRTVALHRTYLTSDGRKADVPTVKKLTPASGPMAGACIPLFKPPRGCIGVAEGIETALAAWCASGVPTVAAYSAGNLATWCWPAGVQRLVIFADADKAGREAADTLRARALAAYLSCEVMTPSDVGSDWADVWVQRGAVTIDGSPA